jgi:hypothetical protein
MDSDLRREFRVAAERPHGSLGQVQSFGERRHGRGDLGGAEMSKGLHRPRQRHIPG